MLESPNDSILQEDLEHLAKKFIDKDFFKNQTILITGATGLIGSLAIKALLCSNRIKESNIRILAMVRNEEKANKIFAHLLKNPNLILVYGDILNPINIDEPIDYIIHGASATSSKYFVTNPVDTILTMVEGTKNILDLARTKNIKSMVYLSSMEAYGITEPTLEFVEEDDYGYIDILNVRSSYSEGKRMAECLCAAYASQYKVPVKIARLAQTFGAGVSRKENRVFAQFAKSVINKTDIILHTKGNSTGNYCYTRDALNAIFLLLNKGVNGEAYTVVNEESHTTIRNMAKMVAEKLGKNEINVGFDIPEDELKYGYAPDVKMKLSSKKMQSLDWKAEIGLEESYRRMIKSMKNRQIS